MTAAATQSKWQLATGAALAVAALVLLGFFVVAILQANPSVQAAIIAAAVAAGTLTTTVLRERSRSYREAHRDKKIEVYSKFYDIIFEMISDPENFASGEITKESPLVKRLSDVARGALFYGSPQVVQAFSNFKTQTSLVDAQDPLAHLRPVGRLLLAMREDIGLSNSGLDEINIHQIYVNDDLKAAGTSK